MPKRTYLGEYDNLIKIGEFVTKEAEAAGLNEKEVYAVQLAVDEACSNIIEHAYGGEAVGEIEVCCDATEEGLRVILRDQGNPFSPDSVPEPNVGAPLEEYGPRGAGLFLMRKLMDEVSFKFEAGKGTILTMLKRRGN